MVKAVWEVDRKLSEVSSSFDFLLQVTPINSNDAWNEFKRGRFEKTPDPHYRPTSEDPAILKRRLYQIPAERIEDPALQCVFRQKQEELDRKITLLRDRDTPRFLYGSLQLYGAVESSLYGLARELLERLPPKSNVPRGPQLDAGSFKRVADAEFDRYRSMYAGFSATAKITGEVVGVMVSRGSLLINPKLTIPKARVNALIQHEVGTHLLTYFNGRAQPFRQLYSGLAGYDELQEGLAVLAEYLVGGLTPGRLRQLAARVAAARQLIEGATFVDIFRTLHRDYGFPQRAAFTTTMRAFRSGGLTKDAVYLRGLCGILSYLRDGGDLERLFVGKFALEHLGIIEELQLRQVLKRAPLRPTYLASGSSEKKIDALRKDVETPLDLVEELTKRRSKRGSESAPETP